MTSGETRYAHCDGYVDSIRFKNYIVSCGQDGDLRVWDKPSRSDDTPSSITLGSQCSCLASQGEKVYCGVDGGLIKAVELLNDESALKAEHEIEPKDFRKFESECLHLASNETHLLVCLADGSSVLCQESGEDITLTGHTGPVLSGALSLEKSLAATASGDGSVRVWSTENGNCLKKLEDVFTPLDSADNVREVTRFHRVRFIGGNLMAVATERSIKIFSLNSFSLKNEHEIDEIIDDEEAVFNMVTDGKDHIGVSTNQGLVSLYKIDGFSQVWLHRFDDTVTSFILPDGNGKIDLILFTDKGELQSMLDVPLSGSEAAPGDDVFNPDEEILAGTGVDRARKPSSDDADEIDLGAIRSAYMPTILGEGQEQDEETGKVIIRETVKTVYRKAFEQEAFQVGEVPDGAIEPEEDDAEEDDSVQERRFVVYNHVGFVVCSISDSDASIDVDFHNSTDRHPFTLPNKEYTMAALDSHVLVLANKTEMMVYLLEPQSGESNIWETELKNDSIVGVTAGQGYVLMATHNQFLRFFTPGGVQREILSLPGPLLCLVGASKFTLGGDEMKPKENLLIFYNQGRGLDDQLNVVCARYKVDSNGISAPRSQQTIGVGLPHKTKIKWAGFTEEYRPSYMNSKGIIFVYNDRIGSWYPVFDSKEKLGRSSCCFVVSVGERFNRLFYIQCKKWCPRVKPLPIMVKEKLHVPLLENSTDKTDLERRYLRIRNLDDKNDVESSMAKLALQMYALALKSERFSRAIDIIRMESGRRETLKLLFEYTEASNRSNRYDNLLRIVNELLASETIIEQDEEVEMEEESDVVVEPLKSQDLMPAAPVLAPKRIILGSLSSDRNGSGAEFNPFKKSSGASKNSKGGQLDDILSRKVSKSATKHIDTPRPTLGQAKLPLMKADHSDSARSPVQIFMHEIIEELKSEKPDGNTESWLRMAAERFRKLTSEERKNYMELSKPPAKRQKLST